MMGPSAFAFVNILVLGLSLQAHAMTDSDYRFKSNQLKRNQAQTEILLKRIQVASGFGAIEGSASGSPNSDKPVPLFQVHDDLTTGRYQPGKLLFGKTANRLVVGSEASPVLVDLDSDQGSLSHLRLSGVARQAGTAGRVLIEFNRILLKSGRSVVLQATALDPAGAYGLEAQAFSGKALALLGAVGSSFVAGLAATQQTQNTNAFGFTQTQPSGRNAILQGIAQSAGDQSKRLIEEATAEKPVLVIESEAPLTVYIQEEVHF